MNIDFTKNEILDVLSAIKLKMRTSGSGSDMYVRYEKLEKKMKEAKEEVNERPLIIKEGSGL